MDRQLREAALQCSRHARRENSGQFDRADDGSA